MRNIYIAALLAFIIITAVVVYANKNILPAQKSVAQSATPIQEMMVNEPLKNTEWVWLHSELPNDELISTPEREKYILTLDDSSRVQSTTDCNIYISKYVVTGEVLSFSPFTSTKKMCSGSLEGVYSKQLALTTSYQIVGNRLYINLNRDAGRMVFEKR